MTMDKRLSSCIVTASLLMTATGCSTQKSGTIEPQSSVAIFDSFSYKGMDDFYSENPLPDASSFYNPILPGLLHRHIDIYLRAGSTSVP